MLIAIGDLALNFGPPGMAAKYYMTAMLKLSEIDDPPEFFAEHSCQDMVRLDCKGVYDFYDPRLAVPNTICTADRALIMADLDVGIARDCLRDGNLEVAAAAIEEAEALFQKGGVFWPSSGSVWEGVMDAKAAVSAAGGVAK